MHRSSVGQHVRTIGASAVGAAVVAVAWAGLATAQTGGGPEPERRYPSIPGAVTRAPNWIGKAPFDVAQFFAAPPRDRNAAPLYLDALFEFSSDLASCFPEGPERDRRSQAAQERLKRSVEIAQALAKDPRSVPASAIDGLLAEYETGFQKLAQAQRRPRCVFQTGLGLTAVLPHAQGARQVVRVAVLRVRRALERRDFDEAIRDVAMTLRLARDLQPRGYIICQLVSTAMTEVITKDMVLPILASPGLQVEHCDQLLGVLAKHEARSIDGYTEGFRTEYLTALVTIRDLVRDQAKLSKELGLRPGASLVAALTQMTSNTAKGAGDQRLQAMDARLAQTTPAELARQVGRLNAYYRVLLGLKGVLYAKRLRELPDPARWFAGDDPLSAVVRMIQPALGGFVEAMGRMEATRRAAECLVAVRRGQLTHVAQPRNLATAIQEAGLPGVPLDPYDGKPMRMALIAGEPVVYSVGKDGRDDGGLKDSNYDREPGDLTYRLLPSKAPH